MSRCFFSNLFVRMLNPFLMGYLELLAGIELAMTSSYMNIKEESCMNCDIGLCRFVINKV